MKNDANLSRSGRTFFELGVPLPVTGLASGAGDGIRVGLAQLLSDNSDEAKMLAFQLKTLNNHLNSIRVA
ncbi:hypothetical protein A2164_00380 [Candidatus Curtissbacteria bacterium RBG_13_35_7]|uniref:Uncharacterized protein n=1 Tax=Candidatus Curtissbacteria bacterium RBG_13_35_7 TaxID=1797705 RepID=A0A1F5G0W7_9BACT|nr:MAG: hypothetical protein A2164_00380 [Candidatus Curtissbacteria bacterium RBG_13_35_7]